jgi:hypothetical protein
LTTGNASGAPRRVLQPARNVRAWDVTWHQFRHIHSSLLNDLGVPVKIAQEQLGHASIATTLNIYTHVVATSHRQAIEALKRQLFPTVPKSRQRGCDRFEKCRWDHDSESACGRKRAPEGSREARTP